MLNSTFRNTNRQTDRQKTEVKHIIPNMLCIWLHVRVCFEAKLSTDAHFYQHVCTWARIQPSSIYNSWRDLVPSLRDELSKFKSWPNYIRLHFAPSNLCFQKSRACGFNTHTHRNHQVLEQMAWFKLNFVDFALIFCCAGIIVSFKSVYPSIILCPFAQTKPLAYRWICAWKYKSTILSDQTSVTKSLLFSYTVTN